MKRYVILIVVLFLFYFFNDFVYSNDIDLANKKLLELLNEPSDSNINKLKTILEQGASANAIDKDGRTVLMKAVFFGRKDSARLLISKGADVNARDKYGNTVLITSAINQFPPQLKVMKLLVENGAKINAKNSKGWTALMEAAKGQPPQMIKKLKEIGREDLANASSEMVKLLVEKGAKINLKDDNGFTALIMAVNNNHIETVRYLMEKGADINIADNYNRTAAFIASEKQYNEILELLEK